jgi:hypothetical protein
VKLGVPWLSVSLRLLYQYFGSFGLRSHSFSTFVEQLILLLEKDESLASYFSDHCHPESLMGLLRSKYKYRKAKVALFIDETMKACQGLSDSEAVDFVSEMASFQNKGKVCTFFTGLRSGPFLRASSDSGRSMISALLPTISEDRHEEFFPPKGLSRLIPEKVLKRSRKEVVDMACLWLSRYLFSLTAGYPRMVEILHRACLYSQTLPRVLSTAVAETSRLYSVGVTSSALALGALNVRVPRGLIVREELPSSDSPAMREACRQLLRDVNSLDHAIPPGYIPLDEMVSRGRVFIKDPGADLKLLTPFVPPLNLLAKFRSNVARADIRAAGELVSELLEELQKESFCENVVHSRALAALRRLELLPADELEEFNPYIEPLHRINDCETKQSIIDIKLSVVSNLTELPKRARDVNKYGMDGSLVDELCTLAADARGMVGDASLLTMCQGIGSYEGYQQTIHEVNSKSIERWHARYECTMRRLYADADQYLPEPNENTRPYYTKPDHSKRSLSEHYGAAEIIGTSLESALFNWTQPLEMVLGVPALPDFSDSNSLGKAKGKMLVMEGSSAGFELAWVAYRVGDEGESKPVLFLEHHKM